MAGATDGKDGGEEGTVVVENVEGCWKAVRPINKAKDGGEAVVGEKNPQHVATVKLVEGVFEVGGGERVGFGCGFEEEGRNFRATRLQGELVRAEDVNGVPEDVVEGVYGSHLV